MTKLEKIEEIIREYENDIDDSISESNVIAAIMTVLDDPTFTRENEKNKKRYDRQDK